MEEDWDVLNLSISDEGGQKDSQLSKLELNFNRFQSRPNNYEIEQDHSIDNNNNNIGCEKVKIANIILNNGKEHNKIDDDNELIQSTRIYHPFDNGSFFLTSSSSFTTNKMEKTRESEADKQALWLDNSHGGSSVPFVSTPSPLPLSDSQKNPIPPSEFSSLFPTTPSFSTPRLQGSLTSNLSQLASDLKKDSPSTRPIKQLKKSNSVTTTKITSLNSYSIYELPSFAGSPRRPPVLTSTFIQHQDIPPIIKQTPNPTIEERQPFTDHCLDSVDCPPVATVAQPSFSEQSFEPVSLSPSIKPTVVLSQTNNTHIVNQPPKLVSILQLSQQKLTHSIDIPPAPAPKEDIITILTQEQSIPPISISPTTQPLSVKNDPIININIPPTHPINVDVKEDASMIEKRLEDCFGSQSKLSIYYEIEQRLNTPDITLWYKLKKLDLSHQGLTALNGLNKCFPMLEALVISHNGLKTIDNLPTLLIYLNASYNKLVEADIYALDKLQQLNISHNKITEFEDLENCKSLRVFEANRNAIESCKPFGKLNSLTKLSLRGNRIRRLTGLSLLGSDNILEDLDISFNFIEHLDSLDTLKRLRYLNADHNNISQIQLDQPMNRLCKLQLSFNRLKSFDVSPFPEIRVLYLDDNQIQRIIGISCITRLDSFSMRDQGRQKVEYNLQYLRASRKLYLSGSPFEYHLKQINDFYSLEYLELCSCGLQSLPANFAKHVPNLNTLYLSMNKLQEIRPLKKLKYLKKLILIDNKLISLNELLSVVKQLRMLKNLDLRQNPMCTNMYPTLSYLSARAPPSAHNEMQESNVSVYVLTAQEPGWASQDFEFCQTLSDHWQTRRKVYRALLIKECPRLVELDHVVVEDSDRDEGDLVIENYHSTTRPAAIATANSSRSTVTSA